MLKMIKGLLVLMVIMVVMLIAAPFVVDVNDYKEEIIALVREETGRELQINDDIKLSVFPWIGIRLGETSLGNPASFKGGHLAKVGDVQVKVKLMPLLSGHVELSRIVMRGLEVGLITAKNGMNNWADLAATGAADAAIGESKDKAIEKGGTIASFQIDGIDIQDAVFRIEDRQADTQLEISDVSLTTEAITLGKPFNIDLQLKVDGLEGLPAHKLPLPIALQASINMGEDELAIDNTVLGLSDSHLTGSINIKGFDKPQLRFDLTVDQLNVDDYVVSNKGAGGASTTSAQSSVNKVSKEDDTVIVLPVKALRELNLGGDLRIARLQVANMKIQDSRITLSARKGLIRLYPFTASLYEGAFKGDVKMDVSGASPRYFASKELVGIQLGSLLQDAMDVDVLTARGDLKVEITTGGNRTSVMRKRLNGKMNVDLGEGVVKGVDILGTLEGAYNTIKGRPGTAEAGDQQTSFSSLHASAIIKQGVLSNNDLLVSSPALSVKGKGKVDLVNEQVDYLLTTRLSGDSGRGLASLRGKDIPVRVKGSLMDPSYTPDLGGILKSQVKKKLKKTLLKKLLGGDESTESGSPDSNGDQLKKSLRGLFR